MTVGKVDLTTEMASLQEALAPIMKKLVSIAKNTYRCDINPNLVEGSDLELSRYRDLASGSGPIKGDSNRKFVFPLHHSDRLVAAIEAETTDDISDQSLNRLNEVIELIVKSSLSEFIRLQQIEFLEKQLMLIDSQGQEKSNVFRMDKAIENKKLSHHIQAIDQKIKFSLAIPCLIESSSTGDIKKMALEIHSNTQRFAFLNFEDLDENIRTSSAELRELGSVTLFISEITMLSEKEQQNLLDYLLQPRTENCPQVISGTICSFKQLLANKTIDSRLLKRVSTSHLKMTKPFAEYLDQRVIDFFYDSITRPTILTTN